MKKLQISIQMAKDMIEDKETTPSRAYRPTVVLISDGAPSDENGYSSDNWEKPLKDFISEGRSSKCDRMAMAIGHDADELVLNRFIEGTPHDLFYAENAGQLHEFFQRVTMSVTTRTQSKNPNEVPASIELDRSVASKVAASLTVEDDGQGYW